VKLLRAVRTAWRGLVRGDEQARYDLAERAARWLYPRYRFSEFGRTFLDDDDFRTLYEELEGADNHHSLDRKYVVDQLVRLTLELPGDTAECGVYRGTSSLLICRRTAGRGKLHHVFDSFEGLSAPAAGDGDAWHRGAMAVDEETVRRNLARFDFVRLHRGWIPERFPEVADARFSFVHVDVDLHQPTRDSLAFFYPRTVPGGILLCDDHGFRSCPGATRAFDEYLADKPEPLISLPTGQAFLIRGP